MIKFVETKLTNDLPYSFNINRLIAFYPYEVNKGDIQGLVLHLNDNRTCVVQMSYDELKEIIGDDNYAVKVRQESESDI